MTDLIFLLFVSLVSATTYRLTVFAPGTVVDGADIDAAGSGFYLGLSEPATYCPVGDACPAPRGTLVYQGMSAMAVEVPGGQDIYIAPHGQVQFTQAHSAYMPPGSLTGGWFNKTVVSECGPRTHVLDFLATNGTDLGGVYLCPNVEDYMKGTGASYRLYTNTPQFNETNCVQAVGLVEHEIDAAFGAWQYT
ncbi:hypothetical protein PFICI_10246 [Pestalotiopsis fici W106-1]|uniref:IgE-binding protein n=1 Tax=Pestalotiopsis fici (strain W106-1 / CGMCC3.15140) TaxID=1229662 RepID=W3WWK0_PESFW|nr:uncharacterized protein PFICI_10246 [Pestalotiopsis fici W106-1]ETS78184.1 hypothetical protein PFICI_10246 [Pestalotiopsis fici W106-1]